MPFEALAGTTNDTCAEELALIDGEQDGEQVVPVESPLIETETDPAKPFDPVIETVTGALVVPACVLTDDGETEIEKSGAAEMVRLSGVEWLKFPLVPCTVSATVPVAAFAGTTNDTWAEELALIDGEQDGEQVVPVESPLMATDTAPENPFDSFTETVTGALVVPACTLTDEDETEMEKAGVGGGTFDADPPPPQPIRRPAVANSQTARTHARRERQGGTPLAISLLLIWSDPVNRCASVGMFLLLSLIVSCFEDRANSSRGRIERRLISLIFAGRNRIIMIRRELPLTRVASPAEPVA